MPYQTDVPHADYHAGFFVGFKAAKGDDARLPLAPLPPRVTTLGLTPFLMGVRDGLEQAGVELDEL